MRYHCLSVYDCTRYYGCRQNFINRHPNVFPQKKAVEGGRKTTRKTKTLSAFSKIIDAFMDEVKFWQSSAGREVFAPKFLSIYEESIKRERIKNVNVTQNNHGKSIIIQ
jgi:hypothetical protein